MIIYFIINKLGTIVYQSTGINSHNNSSNEGNRIRYLPLLVIKDLIKANLNDVIQYIKIGTKTVAFKEQQNLLYIACTKRKNIPIALLQLHFKAMHSFVRFHFGPQWSLQVLGNNSRNTKETISKADLHACLSQLPFLCGSLPTRSCEALCSSEQVQVNDDLRSRLVDNLTNLCNSAFIYQPLIQHHHLHHHRNPFFSSASSTKSNHTKQSHHFLDFSNDPVTTWSHCFLFAREKLVVQCHNTEDRNELQDEFIYFLKLLVAHYLQEKQDRELEKCEERKKTLFSTLSLGLYHIKSTTLPQDITTSLTKTNNSSSSSSSTVTPNTVRTTYNSAASPSSSKSEASTSSQPSSLAYVYDANSSSAPFKIREKSASSVTVVSSDSSISYWSNPFSNNIHSPLKSMELQRTPSNILPPNTQFNPRMQQSIIADLLNDEDNSVSFLSSSVPSDSTLNSTTTYLTKSPFSNQISSAPSSPTHRSRSQSFSTDGGNDNSSLKCILTNLINGETGYLDQKEDVKLVRRWIKLDGRAYLANLILVLINDGICAVIVFKDDPEKLFNQPSKLPTNKMLWKPASSQVKRFKLSAKSYLSDFNSFLLTKEITHFTNISFAVSYPGLVHFIHFDNGIMTAPSLVDLNDLDKNHELLHEVYGKYNLAITERGKWVWPNEPKLKKLCNEILQLSLECRQDPLRKKAIEESKDRTYFLLYQKGSNHQELLAIYFTIMPSDRLWTMHHKLFHDISQRV